MTVLPLLLQPLWEIAAEPIVVTGNEPDAGDRRILYVNEAFSNMTGYSREEAMDRPLNFLYGPDTDQNVVRRSDDQLRTKQAHEFTLTHYAKDGFPHQCVITRAPLVDVDGQSEYLIAIYKLASNAHINAMQNEAGMAGTVPLTLPMPLSEFPNGELPQHLESHPELDALMSLWREVRQKRTLPLRGDFTLDIMMRWASHLSIAIVTPDNRFQFLLFGTKLSEVYGTDLTGCFLDELTPHDLWSVVIQHYQEVVSTGEPLFAPISVSNGSWYTEVSRLLLPLSGDDNVNFIMGADYKRELRPSRAHTSF